MKKNGYTMIEAAVGMLLTAIIASSVFSIALTTKTNSAKGLRKLIADQASRALTEELKNYVSADVSGNQINNMINGPNSGTSRWSLDLAPIDDTSCTNCWALTGGSHTLTGYLPSWFEAAPYNARVSYYVWTVQTVAAGDLPGVVVTVSWTEI